MGHWYAISTRPKAERKALRELTKVGVTAYLPEYQIERFNRRRRVRVVSTLCHFPRYLFALIEPHQFAAVRAADGVADVLPGFPKSPVALEAKEVDALMALRDAQERHLLDDTDQGRRCRGDTVKNTLEAMRKRLKGKKVRVTDGPFTSFAGEVEAVHSLERLRVTINLLGRQTAVELESGQIEELAA